MHIVKISEKWHYVRKIFIANYQIILITYCSTTGYSTVNFVIFATADCREQYVNLIFYVKLGKTSTETYENLENLENLWQNNAWLLQYDSYYIAADSRLFGINRNNCNTTLLTRSGPNRLFISQTEIDFRRTTISDSKLKKIT